jgi:tol-pal system beta propeller repeat protein TolB
MVYRTDGDRVERVPSDGTILGFLPDVRYESRRLRLRAGDCMLLYTDGITEAVDQAGAMFGEDRLAAVFAQLARNRSAQRIVDGIVAELDSYRGGAGPAIYSHDLRTGNRNVVAAFAGSNISPSISPDGSKVAMILSKSGSPDLWVANLDGSGLRQLTRTKGAEATPTWSPDGRTLCFVSDDPGRPTLFTVPAAGGEMTRLKVGGVVHCTEPDWSPDGKQIAFTRSAGEFTIYVVPAGGGDAKAITPGEDPSWAPNSRTLAFTRGKGGSRKLSLLDVPTGRVKDVAKVTGNCSQPSWAR